MNDVRR